MSPHWRNRLSRAGRVLVASDFDGTLAQIVPEPDEAAPLPGAVELLAQLARRGDFRVAIVSGRALSDLRRRCDVPGCWYVGGHGNETAEPDHRDDLAPETTSPGHHIELRQQIASIADDLRRKLHSWPGARMEAKPYSVAVHFRQAPQWETAIRDTFSAFTSRGEFRVMLGRQVIELLPDNALTKGHAVQRLRSRLDCDLVFYFGDDVTDEDVFRLNDAHFIGVKVKHGEGAIATAAAYALSGPPAVLMALREIARVRPLPEKKSLRFSAVQP